MGGRRGQRAKGLPLRLLLKGTCLEGRKKATQYNSFDLRQKELRGVSG